MRRYILLLLILLFPLSLLAYSLDVSWIPPTDDTAKIKVYVSQKEGTWPATPSAIVTVPTNSCLIPNAARGLNYVIVVAEDAAGNVALPSDVASIIVPVAKTKGVLLKLRD
jgi:hypothetical protein